MRIDVVTIFPDYLAALDLSLVGKARQRGLLDLHVHDLRDWTTDRHRTVDDTPFGGGAGMVMRPDVWGRALDEVLGAGPPGDTPQAPPSHEPAPPRSPSGSTLVLPTPSGEVFTQRHAEDLATAEHLVFACGRYEGIDARVAEHYRAMGVDVRELSIGDYVLNGGEVAALVMIEAVGRLVPGMVGNPESLVEESHGAAGLLEYPVYTKPPRWYGIDVPEVLLSGHHARIDRWRRDEALRRTAGRRPEMIAALDGAALDRHDTALLAELGWTVSDDGRVVATPPIGDAPAE
ncbi:tRNA (guanosine(37)-N1)-methyltransferase TrmD [Myceligenerans pegani]|uniref:tRNA (guanine-N(1)-)-methyltransferase n=1 Tax=Myceligenerans pegani TaxID=2776917 RepID=A0ABR9MXX1_9MICO|nr:tRNA (guanosine(37)-N1)-methyltransferase TrmD [Myceligenerans sp. TRM 65318]MBE1876229.1 tRNA (guanosine(37)-N1)-methyltransferase TrmD [Myceligenerans sp. TRM 65318]MBE3018500.1 tRNA (guanosine(37)-N1)-methyltransferase TrmD [Myceligenerans sp. TRM 65318]